MAAELGEPAVDARGAGQASPAPVRGGAGTRQTVPGDPDAGNSQFCSREADLCRSSSDDPGGLSDEEDDGAQSEVEKERRHFERVVLAFRNYAQRAQISNIRRRRDLRSLPARHRNLIPLEAVEKRLDDADEAIRLNQRFLSLVVEGSDDVFGLEARSPESRPSTCRQSGRLPKVRAADFDKVRSTLKQFVRDWSEVGKPERVATYGPILRELVEWFKDSTMEQRLALKVLVPGAGLGRLAFDIAKLGFAAQGNEFSFHMLLSSFFILNRRAEICAYTICPWVHSHSNVLSAQQQLQRVGLPDVVLDLPEGSDFSMVAGDFLEIYGKPDMHEAWDAIVTCFFVDTARNVAHYLEIMYNVLRPGGVWINLGPLLYHFEDMPGETSIELTLEELLEAVQLVGFRILKREFHKCTYSTDRDSMLTYIYDCAMWVAIKPECCAPE